MTRNAMDKTQSCGAGLREAVSAGLVSAIGIYDVFSATIAARQFSVLFVSGFGFAASYYGLPDFGFIGWPDIVTFVQRLKLLLPQEHLLVDIDDGYGDAAIACHVVAGLEAAGASGVVMEDQMRPRRCGHYEGKRVAPLNEFLDKLKRVLTARRDLFVVARTDAEDSGEVLLRVKAFAEAGADAVLADGLKDLHLLQALRSAVRCPITFNQIAGGKSPACSWTELAAAGVSLVIYSTPCLFAAQAGIEAAITELKSADGRLPSNAPVDLGTCTRLLEGNLLRRRQST